MRGGAVIGPRGGGVAVARGPRGGGVAVVRGPRVGVGMRGPHVGMGMRRGPPIIIRPRPRIGVGLATAAVTGAIIGGAVAMSMSASRRR